jgi:hypothetical protein
MELINKTLKNTKSPVGREKLRIHQSGSRLFGRHIIDRFEGQMAWLIWPGLACMYVFEISSKVVLMEFLEFPVLEKAPKSPSIEDGARKYK